jgi:arylsulfatase A-like enzyme
MSSKSLSRRECIRFLGGSAAYFAVSGRAFPLPKTPTQRRPNIVFLVADDQRFDTIHVLGNDVIQTPNLDVLVQDGTAFTQAFASNPLCASGLAAILTGCDGFRSKVRSASDRMDPKLATWPQLLEKTGYLTRYIGRWCNGDRPEDHGFQQVRFLCSDEPASQMMKFEFGGKSVSGFSAELFANSAIEMIKGGQPAPFLACVAFTTPHGPRKADNRPEKFRNFYDPKAIPIPVNFVAEHPFDNGDLKSRDEQILPLPRTPAAVCAEIADYYAMISALDEQIGRILAALREAGLAENTIVIFTSDSGPALGQHGLVGKESLYDHSLRVPLILNGPGIPKGQRSDALCCLQDIHPTVCELIGIEVPEAVEGMSLAPVLAGKLEEAGDCVFASHKSAQRMIRTEDAKLIWYPQIDKMQLFDLASDPFEVKDLSDDPKQADLLADLCEELADWMKSVGDDAKPPKVKQVADAKAKPVQPATPTPQTSRNVASQSGIKVNPSIGSGQGGSSSSSSNNRPNRQNNNPRRRSGGGGRRGGGGRGYNPRRQSVPRNPGSAPRPGGSGQPGGGSPRTI